MNEVIGRYPWYDNDILDAAINAYRKTGYTHLELLESVVGIGKLIQGDDIEEAQKLGVQLRIELVRLKEDPQIIPSDTGQFMPMMCGDQCPPDVLERMARELGYPSLEGYKQHAEEIAPGITTGGYR
jgi:hypothetical protein